MKAVVSERYGSVEVRDVDVPEIEDGQVLVRVLASSVNPAEWYRVMGPVFVRMGEGLRRPKSPALGADLAGRVEAVGKGVTELAPGDEVFGTSAASWAEYARSREERLVPKPANVSFEEAAAVPVAGLTALQALRDHGQVEPGQKVLINGASGGVGTFAVQLARVLGAEVTAVCSTSKVEQARELGAGRVVDYTQEDFTRSGARYDLLVDVAGRRRFRELRRVLKPKATVVKVGDRMSARGLGPLPGTGALLLGSLGRSQAVKFFIAKITKDDLVTMAGLLADGAVRPVVERTYPLAEAAEALRHLGEGHARGKLVLVP